MLGFVLAFVWFGAISLALVALARVERRARVEGDADRVELAPPRALWGGGIERPPGHSMLARSLSGGARLVRAGTRIGERARGLRFAARAVSCVALASALALIPFASSLGGRPGDPPLVVVDLAHGLVALLLFVLLAAMAQVAVGLSEASPFARLACVRLAGRVLATLAVFALVLAPLALAADSLRLHAIVMEQQASFTPFASLSPALGLEEGGLTRALERIPLPAWSSSANRSPRCSSFR